MRRIIPLLFIASFFIMGFIVLAVGGEPILSKDSDAQIRAINRNIRELENLGGRHIKPKQVTTGKLNAGDVEISDSLTAGATVQAGYLDITEGVYISRGVFTTTDFATPGGITTDGGTYTLDLSGIIPVGSKSVRLAVLVFDDAVSSFINIRKNGTGSTNQNRIYGETQVANIPYYFEGIVACDGDRKIEYNTSAVTFSSVKISVKGAFK